MISIRNVGKQYRNKIVLDNISLDIARGEIAFLLGSSGVGKSTLLRILSNLEKADSGAIFLDNKELDPVTVQKNHLVGMVFQQFNLFDHLSVEKNISLPLEKILHQSNQAALQNAHILLTKYGLFDKAKNYPRQLSGGQKQRLAIARAIAMKPILICMDEPTSALDPRLTTHIAHTIQELAQEGYMVLVASHDISLLEKLVCSVYLMDKGTIVESTKSTHFFNNRTHFPHINAFVNGTTN